MAGEVGQGLFPATQGIAGPTWQGTIRFRLVGLGFAGKAGCGLAWWGLVRRGMAGEATPVWARQRKVWQAWPGLDRLGAMRLDRARQARRGMELQVTPGPGMAGAAKFAVAWRDPARQRFAGAAWRGLVRRGVMRVGSAGRTGQGLVGRCSSRQGIADMAWHGRVPLAPAWRRRSGVA
jgi:hypothetical protein